MMMAHCPGDPLQYLLIMLGFYGIITAGFLVAAWLLSWGMGGRDRH